MIDSALTPESVLKAIIEAAENTKGRAALSHYPSRRLWTRTLHQELSEQAERLRELLTKLHVFANDEAAGSTQVPETSDALFARIIPVLVRHHLSLLQKLLTVSEPLPIYKRGDLAVAKTFDDFNELLNSVRQYTDATVQDAYQLTKLDASEFNYGILSSLSSFLQLAPISLQVPFMTEELLEAVRAFEEDKGQTFARRDIRRFHEATGFLVRKLNPVFVSDAKAFLEQVFRFSSDFAHAGLMSSIVTSTDPGGVYLGGPDGVFLASTENYVEVQYIVLKACLLAFGDVYLRALDKALSKLFDRTNENYHAQIETGIAAAKRVFDATGHQFHAWISNDAMLRNDAICMSCPCGKAWFKMDQSLPSV
ncbi:MAG: hypothetical protein WBM04_04605 [Candidatus Korobacteraceae bacterium]